MSILSLLLRILRAHFAQHLLIPLLFGIFCGLIVLWIKHKDLGEAFKQIFSWEKFAEVTAIILTYCLLMAFQVYKDTAIEFGGTDRAVLYSKLDNAKTYFATSAIPIEEWFDPISQVYFSAILKHKLQQHVPVHDERVLLLFDREEDLELRTPYLTGYYGRSLAAIHSSLGIPLGFLRRAEILDLLSNLTDAERGVLGYTPGWKSMSRIPELDFALVERQDGTKTVLRVGKDGENLRITPVEGPDIVAFQPFVDLIRERTGSKKGQFDPQHDFIRFYFP